MELVRGRCGWLWAMLLLAAGVAQADRQPVLGQIDLPHAYYYREMYLPQVTGGPSAVTFSPDSREVVYAMAGSLWRQSLDSGVAVQLTDGPGYDYQPDWSPDGRSIVYVTYRHDTLSIAELDLATGTSRLLTHDAAVNLEPRWSPDGRRIVFVSTAFNRRFHVYTADVGTAGLERVTRLTGEAKSPLRRYYYSAYDHEINPVWTRDGRSILYVSNRGHIHGTGGFWQMEAVPGAAAREIHYEETNWRARPDFSPDGTRLLYSSYLGRNTHQLWLMPAGGGDALPITYGDWDAVSARWSPDGRQIAYVSNRDGDLALWLHDVVGGAAHRLAITEHRYLVPHGRIELRLRDAGGAALAGRVSVTDAQGRTHAPWGAWIHADDGFDRAQRPFEAHYFHSGGDDVVEVPAGDTTVEIVHGLGRAPELRHVQVTAGATATVASVAPATFPLETAGGRWVSGDVHVHMNYAGLYRDTPARLLAQAAAEDLSLVNALVVNKEQRVPDIAVGASGLDPLSGPDRAILHGQEFHTSYWGHLGLLGLKGGMLVPGYVGYPNTAAASLLPMNADVADLAHARGALVGYVHPFDPDEVHPLNAAERLTNELPVDVALGKVDYIEVLGFSDHRTTAAVWYRLLNLGFRIPAAAGTDLMGGFASVRGPVGMNRVYVAVPGATLDVEAWLAGLKAGRTFATNGPLLDFTLDGQPVSSELRYPAGRRLRFHAHLRSIAPVDHLEVVCNGRLAATVPLSGGRTAADVDGSVSMPESGWCVLRASTDHAEYPILDNYVYATTSPVYVTIAGKTARSPADAAYFSAWIDRVRETTERYPDWNTPAEKVSVLARLAAAQAIYDGKR